MSQLTAPPGNALQAANLEQRVRSRIAKLSYLPTTVAVAMKFVELGKNPEAEPIEYARVIEADSSLSSKVLALANSPWFGVRNKVTNVRLAVNLLGLATVRTMAISYCVAGLHNELRLSADESRMFWEAALMKGVAAKLYAQTADNNIADEAFVGGMFQDLALPVMYAIAKDEVLPILSDAQVSTSLQLEKERELFRLDHAEIGRILAEKLELPECFVDTVAFHHDTERLADLAEKESLVDAVHVAALFPHLLNAWNQADAEGLCEFLDKHLTGEESAPSTFLESVEKEFKNIYQFFEVSEPPANRLAELMAQAAREGADNTTHLVKTVHQLMREAASMGIEMHQLVQSQEVLEAKAYRDPLTGVLNREGLNKRGDEILANAARYNVPAAVIYLDLDRFKTINDTLGHDLGDRALKAVAARMTEVTRQHDVVGRVGGDELVLVFYDCAEQAAEAVAKRLVATLAEQTVGRGPRAVNLSASLGLLFVKPSAEARSLEALLSTADQLMYAAKQAGGNRVNAGTT